MKKLSFLIIGLGLGHLMFAQSPVDSKGRPIKAPINATQLNAVNMKQKVQKDNVKNTVFLESGGVLVDATGKTVGRMSKNKNRYPNANGQFVLPEDERCKTFDSKGRLVVHPVCQAKTAVCEAHNSKKPTSITSVQAAEK